MNNIYADRLRFVTTLVFVTVAFLAIPALFLPLIRSTALPSAIAAYIVTAIWTAPRFVRAVSLILFLSGLALLPTTPEPAALWAEALNRNSGLFVLFLAVPLLGGAFVRLHGKPAASLTTTGGGLFQMLSIAMVQFLLSVIVSIGSIWITIPTFRRDGFRSDTIHRGATLGYSTNVTISPFDVVLHTALLLGGVTYYQLLPGALLVSVLYVASFSIHEYLVQLRNYAGKAQGPKTPSFLQQGAGRRLFLIHISILMVATTGGTYLFPNQPAAIVTGITGMVYSMLWIMVDQKKNTPGYVYGRLVSEIPRFTGFLPLLIAATFFGAIVPHTFMTGIVPSLETVFLGLPAYVSVLLLIVGTVILAAMGIHMLVTIVLMGSIFSPALFGLTPIGFTLMLMVAYVSAMNLSPIVPFTVVLSAANGEKTPFSVIRDNWLSWVIIVTGSPLLLLLLYGK